MYVCFLFFLPRHSMLTQQSLQIHCDSACSPALCPALPWLRTSQTCSTSFFFWSPQIYKNWSRSEVCCRRTLVQVCHVHITFILSYSFSLLNYFNFLNLKFLQTFQTCVDTCSFNISSEIKNLSSPLCCSYSFFSFGKSLH